MYTKQKLMDSILYMAWKEMMWKEGEKYQKQKKQTEISSPSKLVGSVQHERV
jgi:hypothetical protein